MDISVVVPCLNEAHNLAALLRLLSTAARAYDGSVEVVVVDGGSDDGTAALLAEGGRGSRAFRRACTLSTAASRARQMNAGATASTGRILYFVHADTRPPLSCFADVAAAAAARSIGGYATEFDSPSRLLRFNAWLTRFNVLATRGGDQSLFVTRELFGELGGYRDDMAVMEEYDLIRRASRRGCAYALLDGETLVSDRKYHGRSWTRVQVANVTATLMWRLGRPSARIAETYATLLSRNETGATRP